MNASMQIRSINTSTALLVDSALADVTTLALVEGVGYVATTVRPLVSLSAGERLLWDVLGYVNGFEPLPDFLDLADRLDAVNFRLAAEAIDGAQYDVRAVS